MENVEFQIDETQQWFLLTEIIEMSIGYARRSLRMQRIRVEEMCFDYKPYQNI
tara:strand:+ start:178128 stop:178286 length:159 start_codon:yes stop_codon:yes gene_type:complete